MNSDDEMQEEVEGSDRTDDVQPAPKMEIQFGEEKRSKLSPVPLSCRRVSGISFPFHAPSVSNVRRAAVAFSEHVTARSFRHYPFVSEIWDKQTETSCQCSNVHTAEFDSNTGSLYSWGLKLINPH